jgi:nucleoside 2-deoxyribosyltransferase
MKVYLAGTISGASVGSATGWRDYAKSKLKEYGVLGYSPMRGTAYVTGTRDLTDKEKVSFYGQNIDSIVGINVRDFNDCKTADAVLVNLIDAPKVSIGTVMEIAWARAFQIPVVIVMEKENIHNHGMLTYGNVITDNLDEGIKSIVQILCP